MEKRLSAENFVTKERFCNEGTDNCINKGVRLIPTDAMHICHYYLPTAPRREMSYTLPP